VTFFEKRLINCFRKISHNSMFCPEYRGVLFWVSYCPWGAQLSHRRIGQRLVFHIAGSPLTLGKESNMILDPEHVGSVEIMQLHDRGSPSQLLKMLPPHTTSVLAGLVRASW